MGTEERRRSQRIDVCLRNRALRELRVVWYIVEADKEIDMELCGGTGNHLCEI